MRSLLELLWTDLKANPKGNGSIIPGLIPAVGLPYRVASFLLAEALKPQNLVPEPTDSLATIWAIKEGPWPIVVEGRISQFDVSPSVKIGQETLSFSELESKLLNLVPVSEAGIRIHAAYRITEMVEGCSSDFVRAWCHALSFLTAIDGCEHILDQIWESAPSAIPLDERWSLRSRIPMQGQRTRNRPNWQDGQYDV